MHNKLKKETQRCARSCKKYAKGIQVCVYIQKTLALNRSMLVIADDTLLFKKEKKVLMLVIEDIESTKTQLFL